MPSREPDNLYRLANFAESVLLPAVELSRWDNTWVHASALEAFLWLDAGVKIGAFPEEPARELASSVSDAVKTSLESLGPTGLVPDYMLQIAQRSFDRGEYFVKDSQSYVDSAALVPVFETLLYCAIEHSRATETKNLFAGLWLESDERWERMRSEPVAPYLASRQDRDYTHAAVIVEAFTTSIGYWIEMDAFLQRLLEDDRGDASSRIALAGDASAIQIWKFNFTVPQVRDRAHIAATMAMTALPAIDRTIGATVLGREADADLRSQLETLMTRWQSRMEYAVGAATV